MNALDLIGTAGAAALEERLQGLGPDSGTARFMLDRLTGPQVAGIVRQLVSDSSIQSRVKIAVPRALVDGQGLPETVLTDERTVAWRHAECDRPALLIANTDDDQGASLHDVALIGAKELKEGPAYWVLPASDGLGLPAEHIDAWQTALKALSSVDDWPLAQLSNYVAMTREAIEGMSLPVADALGWALPALQLPRDTGYFRSQRPKDLQQQNRWRRLYDKLISDRRPLLSKQRPNRQPIESEELRDQFDTVRDEIATQLHPTIEAFIASPAGWRDETEKLAELEWEQDNILLVFSGLKLKKLKLPEETVQFFDYERPDRLSDADKSYLADLKGRSLKESREDDREFFEAHREDLAANRQLRAKWEKFVYGRPIECTDFLDGLVRSIERLFAQLGTFKMPRRIDIRSSRRTKTQWLDMNVDVARAFSLKYKALPHTLPQAVSWDTPHIFEFEALLEAARKRRKFRENVSTSRANIQIKFDLILTVGEGPSAEKNVVQLIWRGEPNAIGLALPDDLARLEKNPFGIVGRLILTAHGDVAAPGRDKRLRSRKHGRNMVVRLPCIFRDLIRVRILVLEGQERLGVEPCGTAILGIFLDEFLQRSRIAELKQMPGQYVADALIVVRVELEHGPVMADRIPVTSCAPEHRGKARPGAHVGPGFEEAPEVAGIFLEPFLPERQFSRLDPFLVPGQFLFDGFCVLFRKQDISVGAQRR